ncbi:MAG: hypothetical protein WC476_01220 [Phycisphaerae bacterium]|jgi:hypothetical protein
MLPRNVRICLITSLQGPPEETSPNDNLDTRRIGIALENRFKAAGFQTNLLNRDDFPNEGDAYLHAIQLARVWGPTLIINIHQDDIGNSTETGWLVEYNDGFVGSKEFAEEIAAVFRTMIPIGTSRPATGGVIIDDHVAATKNVWDILIEYGMYGGTDEQKVTLEQWAEATYQGTLNCLIKYFGLNLTGTKGGKKEVAVSPLDKMKNEGNLFVFSTSEAWYDLGNRKADCFLTIISESDSPIDGAFFCKPWKDGAPPSGYPIHLPEKNNEGSRQSFNLAEYGPTGGFGVTVKLNNDNVNCKVSILEI